MMARKKRHIRKKTYISRKIIPLSQLPLCHDFMFGMVMRNERICILFLEALLGKKIDHIEFIERQEDMSDIYGGHGIRLDVYLKDEKGTIYNIEMQCISGDNLEMRVRYYQSGIDRRTLEAGVHYADMKDSYVIFVCAFDYFGRGQAVYEKKSFMKGIEDGDYTIPYEDGSHVYFLNSQYKRGNAEEPILEFLDYLRTDDNTKEYNSELVQSVKEAVEDVRHDKSKEGPYMTMAMKLEDVRRASFLEGEAKGEARGISKGIGRGRIQGKEEMAFQLVKELMKNEGWSFVKACDSLSLSEDMRKKIEKSLLN